jgi:hypothetical protein
MAEEKKEPWLNYLALSTVIFAVCATLSTFKGGSFSTRSVMSQTQAANQWAYYQAKSLKGYLYEIQKELLELELGKADNTLTPSAIEAHKQVIDNFAKKIDRYDDEKAQIQQEARKLESVRDQAQNNAQIFGFAVIFLQIAILLASISALMKKKPVWFLSLLVGTAGLVYFADGFLLFF